MDLIQPPDILAAVAKARAHSGWPKVVFGFAAETQDLLQNAQAKLQAKQLDLIVANDVGAADSGFNVDTNRVVLLHADGTQESLPLLSKDDVAQRITQVLVEFFQKG